MLRRMPIVLVVALAAAGPAAAQQLAIARPPARPSLPEGADTNSAAAYMDFGNSRLRGDPGTAAAAYYWASRLDPANAEALYARRIALAMGNPGVLRAYAEDLQGRRMTRERRYLDSLHLRALRLDPFLREDLTMQLLLRIIDVEISESARQQGVQASHTDIEFYARDWLRSADPEWRAQYAYCSGAYADALRTWAEIAHNWPHNSLVHAERARAFVLMGTLDSARAEMQRALEIERRAGADSIRIVYESKASWEYALGRIHEGLADPASAREAYERALLEDLSYFPAHLQLGRIRFAAGDTVGAMQEYQRAVLAAEDEYLPRAAYGYRLARLGQLDSAAVHLRRAVEIEPYAAEARFLLAAVLDALGEREQAVAAFQAFVARARRDDPRLPAVNARLARLTSGQ